MFLARPLRLRCRRRCSARPPARRTPRLRRPALPLRSAKLCPGPAERAAAPAERPRPRDPGPASALSRGRGRPLRWIALKVARCREADRALRWIALKVDSRRSRACRRGGRDSAWGAPPEAGPEEPRRPGPRRRWGRPAAEEPASPRPLTMPGSRPLGRKRQPMDEGEVGSAARR